MAKKIQEKPTFKDIFNLNIKYIEYLLAKTHLSQFYVNNIQVAGSEIEREIRDLLHKLIPKRFSVTHGYIIAAKDSNEEPTISPQVDIIIVDTLVPHSIYVVDEASGIEVVPVEAVVGIFEIKRTLNKVSFLGSTKRNPGAVKHLKDICVAANVTKTDKSMFLPGGLGLGPSFSSDSGYSPNPIVGVITVDHIEGINEKMEKWIVENKVLNDSLLDIIVSLNGFLVTIGTKDNSGKSIPTIIHVRKSVERDTFCVFREGTDENYSKGEIVSRALGYIVSYLAGSSGKAINPNHYFWNKSLKKE